MPNVPIALKSRKLSRVVLLLAAFIAILCFATYLTVLHHIGEMARLGGGGSAPFMPAYPSPALSNALIVACLALWITAAWHGLLVHGWSRTMLVVGLLLAVPAGLWLVLFVGARMPAPMASINEANGRKVMLGIEPVWDVRAYQIYDPIWGGLAWRPRDGARVDFWEYPYGDEMTLGLDKAGRAVILGPDGHGAPFPDGLNSFPCQPGKSSGCIRLRDGVERLPSAGTPQ